MITRSRLIIVGSFFAFTSGLLTAQDKKPDFSGSWVMVSPEAGNPVRIRQDSTTFAYGRGDQENGPMLVVKLDGSESRNDMPIGSAVSRATWNGNQLVIKTTISGPNGEGVEQQMVFSLDANKQLTLVVTNDGHEPATMIFRKQP